MRFNASISTKLLAEYLAILDGPRQPFHDERKKALQAQITIEAVSQYADETKEEEAGK